MVNYLKALGIARFDVDAANYDPVSAALTRSRPDTAAMMKSAHQAAAYDKWLKAEIQIAIDDTSPMTLHDEAMRQIRSAIRQA